MNDTVIKLLVTAAAVGIYVLSHFLPELSPLMVPLAAAMIGGMWIPAPGMMKTPAPNTTTVIRHEVIDDTPVTAVEVKPEPLPPVTPFSDEAPPA